MPGIGGPKGRKRGGGGGRLSMAFNALADPYASLAFASNAFDSDAYRGDGKEARSQPSATTGSPWG